MSSELAMSLSIYTNNYLIYVMTEDIVTASIIYTAANVTRHMTMTCMLQDNEDIPMDMLPV